MNSTRWAHTGAVVLLGALLGGCLAAAESGGDTLTIESPQCAGLSGFRAHWDKTIPVAEDGERVLRDAAVQDRGQDRGVGRDEAWAARL